jgi:hypothetical protein
VGRVPATAAMRNLINLIKTSMDGYNNNDPAFLLHLLTSDCAEKQSSDGTQSLMHA